ncbi:MAG TPA: 30S ribosomal protein S16 [Longimicrobium sp.]|jgi:small subunit ribosomal protein S16
MALKIRLRRMGRKKAPHYRIVVAESSMARDGRFVAKVGHYNPTTTPMTLVVDRDKVLAWMAKGAQPTETVNSLFRKAGVFGDAPTVTEQATAVVGGAAKKAGKAVSGAASAVAGAVASAASAVAGAVTSAASAVTGGGDDAATTPDAVSGNATGSDNVAVEAEATEPAAAATDPGTPAVAADAPVAQDAEATEPTQG